MREWLGPDHPVVRRLMTKESPDALATRLIAETKLDDANFRKRLWQGGKSAVDASLDPMIDLARSIDVDARAIRQQYEDEVEAPIAAAAEKIAAARFKVLRHQYLSGCNVYPAPELRYGARMGGKRHECGAVHLFGARIRTRHRRRTVQDTRELDAA